MDTSVFFRSSYTGKNDDIYLCMSIFNYVYRRKIELEHIYIQTCQYILSFSKPKQCKVCRGGMMPHGIHVLR